MNFRMCFFGKIQIQIFDPRSLRSWCIKGTDESTLGKDSSVPLMHHDPTDLGSKTWIRIFPKKRTLSLVFSRPGKSLKMVGDPALENLEICKLK